MPDLTILLAGVLGVGKTTIFKRIETGEFVQSPSPTIGSPTGRVGSKKSDVEMEHFIYTETIEGKEYKVNIWDTGGLERYNSMTSSYFRYCHAVILVYNSSPERMHTLFALKEWIDEAKKSSFIGEQVIFSLWENKTGTHPLTTEQSPAEEDMILLPEVTAFLQEHSIPKSLHFTVSALTGENIIESLQSFIAHVGVALTEIRSTSITLSDRPESVEQETPSSADNIQQPWHRRICGRC